MQPPASFSWSSAGVSFPLLVDRYSSIPIFQDAEGDELLIHRSPYRRPLRCHDNRRLDFEKPLPREMLTSNSALAAARILVNVYEADTVLVPNAANVTHVADHAQFYGTDTRLLAAAIRPTLERHLFGFMEERTYEPVTSERFVAHLGDVEESLGSAEEQPALAVAALSDRERLARFVLLQHAPLTVFASPLVRPGAIRAHDPNVEEALATYTTAAFAAATQEQRAFLDVLRARDLSAEPHVYWQFYMPASLIRCAFLHSLARDSAHVFRFIGGLGFAQMALEAEARARDVMLREVFGDSMSVTAAAHAESETARSLQSVIASCGAAARMEMYQGFEEARAVRSIATESLREQLRWASRLGAYEERARTLFARIQAGEIVTPLDTFAEVSSERSTTHVHDTHRLLVIESGSMDFWPTFGEPRRMNAGDVMLVPRHCLHGSVVRSSECVYHQPLVSSAMMEGWK